MLVKSVLSSRRTVAYVFLTLILAGYVSVALWTVVNVNANFPSDIAIYLEAGQSVRLGTNPYEPFVIGESFVYPPTALLLFAPLATLQMDAARLVWMALNTALYVAGLSVIAAVVRPDISIQGWIWLVSILLLFTPFLENLMIGQVNAWVMLGLALFVLGAVDKEYRWVGDIGLAVAIAIKMTPAVLLILPLMQKDYGRCARVAAALGGAVLVSVIIFGVSPWWDFFAIVPRLFVGHAGFINQAIAPTLRWAAAYFFPWSTLRWISPVITIAFLAPWMVLALAFGKRLPLLPAYAFGIVTMVVSSSLIWFHHLMLFALPAIYMGLPRLRNRATLTVAALTWIAWGLMHIDRLFENQVITVPFPVVTGYLILYACAAFHLWLLHTQTSREYSKLNPK